MDDLLKPVIDKLGFALLFAIYIVDGSANPTDFREERRDPCRKSS